VRDYELQKEKKFEEQKRKTSSGNGLFGFSGT
jgi:hypothetical protein